MTLLEQLKQHAKAKEWEAALKLLRLDPEELDVLRAENERLRAALTCVVAALDENHIAVLPRPNACAVETDALRLALSPPEPGEDEGRTNESTAP